MWVVVGMVGVGKRGAGSSFQSLYVYRQEEDEEEERGGSVNRLPDVTRASYL